MTRDEGVSPYAMGPLPSNVRPFRRRRRPSSKPAPAAVSSPGVVELDHPTRYVRAAAGDLIVENLNRCMICHKPRHRDIPHHEFIPAQATPGMAQALGWPLPTLQEPLL